MDKSDDELLRRIVNADRGQLAQARQALLDSAREGLAWGRARVALAKYELGLGEYTEAAALARAVLDAAAVNADARAKAVAGIVVCDAVEALDGEVDEQLLDESIAGCMSTNELCWAAAGTLIVARATLWRGDREAGKALFAKAADLYNRGGAPVGGPEALLRLARLEIEDGRRVEAVQRIDEALAHIAMIPLRMTGSRLLEQRLLALRATIV